VILPKPKIFENPCFAGIFTFNGNGELTGSHWIRETGLLTSPIMITNTFSIGAVSEGVLEFIKRGHKPAPPGEEDMLFWGLPIVVRHIGSNVDLLGRDVRWISQ